MTGERTCTWGIYSREIGGSASGATVCGETLVDDETSPCAVCGRHHEGLCLMGPGDDASYVASAYRCPVHGAVK